MSRHMFTYMPAHMSVNMSIRFCTHHDSLASPLQTNGGVVTEAQVTEDLATEGVVKEGVATEGVVTEGVVTEGMVTEAW